MAQRRNKTLVYFLVHGSRINSCTRYEGLRASYRSDTIPSSKWSVPQSSPSRPEVPKRRVRNHARHWTARTSSARGEPLADSRAHVRNSCACTDAFSLPLPPLSFPFLSNYLSSFLQPSLSAPSKQPLSSFHHPLSLIAGLSLFFSTLALSLFCRSPFLHSVDKLL